MAQSRATNYSFSHMTFSGLLHQPHLKIVPSNSGSFCGRILCLVFAIVLLAAGSRAWAQEATRELEIDTTVVSTTAPTSAGVTLVTQAVVGPSVLAEAGPANYWIIVRERLPAEGGVVTVIRGTELTVGKPLSWRYISTLSRPVIATAAIDRRLAVLYADGSWQLVWQGSVAQGPVPPDGLVLRTIAGAGNHMIALASPIGGSSTALRLLRFDNGWTDLGETPIQASATGSVLPISIDEVQGGSVIASVIGIDDTVSVWSRDQAGKWTELPNIDTSMPQPHSVVEWAKVVNAPVPTIAIGRGGSSIELRSFQQTKWTAPVVLPIKPKLAGTKATSASVGSDVRIIWAEIDGLYESSFSNAGKPLGEQPSVIPTPRDPSYVSGWDSIMTLLMLALLAVALSTTSWRGVPEVDIEKVRALLAPLGRRFIAGLIDATPLIGAFFWIALLAQSTNQDPWQGMTTQQEIIFGIGLGVYILHTAILEMLTARSLGKWLTGLRVVGSDGLRPGRGPLLLRNLMRLLDLYLVPLMLVWLTPMRQRLGDIASRTFVVLASTRDAPTDSSAPSSATTPVPGDSVSGKGPQSGQPSGQQPGQQPGQQSHSDSTDKS